MVGFEIAESPQRVLEPGLDGQDEACRRRPAAIVVITPTESDCVTESPVTQIPGSHLVSYSYRIKKIMGVGRGAAEVELGLHPHPGSETKVILPPFIVSEKMPCS